MMEIVSESRCFGGRQRILRHGSEATGTPMQLSVFLPPAAESRRVPVLYFLSGLTCTEENFMVKSGAQRIAAELGLMLVSPDTSPRGEGVPDDPDGDYDFGLGAGFYVNATQAPWSQHYHMYDYVTTELQVAVFRNFPGDSERHGLCGHSMGGHGALVIGLRNRERYASISAFAPIVSPTRCPWGERAFSAYLGTDRAGWSEWDASLLVAESPHPQPILIDQGSADGFLEEQLKPELFEAACRQSGQALELRIQEGYDHSYYFIATFIGDHVAHAARALSPTK